MICLGGLLDSNLPIKLQMWLFDKSPISANTVINDIPPEHRLSQSNPTFRGYAWVPEGAARVTAILNQPDGLLIQDLPFSIELNKFIVDYYSTGMPKLFASDIVVIDHKTGKRVSGARRGEQAVRLRRRVDLSIELPGRRLANRR